MGYIYKEKVKRSPLPFVALLVLILVGFLAISKVQKIYTKENYQFAVDAALFVFFIALGGKLKNSSNTEYKYSLISGELMVHKTVNDVTTLKNRIDLKDIVEVEKVRNPFKKMILFFSDCSCLLKRTWRITTKENGSIKSIYIRPSDNLIAKIKLQKYKNTNSEKAA